MQERDGGFFGSASTEQQCNVKAALNGVKQPQGTANPYYARSKARPVADPRTVRLPAFFEGGNPEMLEEGRMPALD